MKTKNKDQVIFIISCILCLSIGITLGKLFNWGYFVLDTEISVPDALSIFISIGLAIYITNALEKQIQNRRIEKDLLLSKVGEIEQSIGKLSEVVNGNDIDYYKLISIIKNCTKSTNIIFNTLNDLKLKTVEVELQTKLRGNIHDLRQLSTKTSVISNSSSSSSEISIEDGLVRYSNARIIEIDSILDDMKDNYFKLKFMINME